MVVGHFEPHRQDRLWCAIKVPEELPVKPKSKDDMFRNHPRTLAGLFGIGGGAPAAAPGAA